ncbi:unnamed protein product [Adineta ricciae]|uniref:Snake toxin/toxin-like domain-containing protein n=1 Tax=Adineta ricciae TaxID=249248 RepID=A0A814TW76_ADIRI|nr:unnamed protein product [Adineta ricciae]
MANQVSQILITVLILSVFYIQFGSALICWTCDPCPEPFTNTSTTTSIRAANCSSSNTICVKNTVRIVNRSPQISKGCVSSCTQSGSNSFGVGAFVDCCNTDYCNSSPRNQITLPIYALCLFTLGFIFYNQHQ